jgi:hypothetical protein
MLTKSYCGVFKVILGNITSKFGSVEKAEGSSFKLKNKIKNFKIVRGF